MTLSIFFFIFWAGTFSEVSEMISARSLKVFLTSLFISPDFSTLSTAWRKCAMVAGWCSWGPFNFNISYSRKRLQFNFTIVLSQPPSRTVVSTKPSILPGTQDLMSLSSLSTSYLSSSCPCSGSQLLLLTKHVDQRCWNIFSNNCPPSPWRLVCPEPPVPRLSQVGKVSSWRESWSAHSLPGSSLQTLHLNRSMSSRSSITSSLPSNFSMISPAYLPTSSLTPKMSQWARRSLSA